MAELDSGEPTALAGLQELLTTLPPLDIATIREAVKRFPCRRCGSHEITGVALNRSLFHAGKAVCGGCGRFIVYLPRHRDASLAPPPEVLARAKSLRRPAARLRGGSADEIERATAVRARMVRAATRRRDLNRALVLRAIADAGWFLGHERVTRYSRITWPILSQLAAPAPFVGPQSDRFASSAPDPLDDLIEALFRHEAGQGSP